jgi:hypothetical protein
VNGEFILVAIAASPQELIVVAPSLEHERHRLWAAHVASLKRIQLSRSATNGALNSWRIAQRCSALRPLIERSISNRASMHRTASSRRADWVSVSWAASCDGFLISVAVVIPVTVVIPVMVAVVIPVTVAVVIPVTVAVAIAVTVAVVM